MTQHSGTEADTAGLCPAGLHAKVAVCDLPAVRSDRGEHVWCLSSGSPPPVCKLAESLSILRVKLGA